MRIEKGRLSAAFDANFAFLREIALDGEELFRGIGFVVRDANWGTPALAAAGVAEAKGEALVVEAKGALGNGAGDLDWSVKWEIAPTYVQAEARWSSRAGFQTNRTGFVVLHSLAASRGRPVVVIHPEGTTEPSRFPELVSPHQPFFDIAGLSYDSAGGAGVRLIFAGEVFEIEDQRNWTDASYKTYCRPLRLPFPYRIEPGAEGWQRVRLELRPVARSGARRVSDAPLIGPPAPAPQLGVSIGPEPPAPGAAAALRALDLDFTAIELELAGAGITDALAAAAGPVRLDFRPAPREARLEAVRRAVAELAGRPCLGLTLWGADDEEIAAARELAGGLRVGAGSASFFAELNRMRPLPTQADYLAFAATPTVHGDSDDTIGETTEPWEDLIATYEAIAGGRELHLGPLTLRMRFNPNATTEEGRRPGAPDPRQLEPIAAAWMLAAIASAHCPTIRAISVFEPCGPRGLVSESGALTPAGQVLRWLRPARGKTLSKVGWGSAPRARALLLDECEARKLWIAHSKADAQTLSLPPGLWRVDDSFATEDAVVEGCVLQVQGFGVVCLSGKRSCA